MINGIYDFLLNNYSIIVIITLITQLVLFQRVSTIILKLLKALIRNMKFNHLKISINQKIGKKNDNSWINELMHNKVKQHNRGALIVILSLISYWFAGKLFIITVKNEVILFLSISIIMITISELLIVYRVRKGYYGLNYEELKEVLYYSLNNNDINTKNNGEKIFNEQANDAIPKELITLNGKKNNLSMRLNKNL